MGSAAAARQGHRPSVCYTDEHLRSLYEAMACGVLVRDGKGRIMYANQAALRILGVDVLAPGEHLAMPTGARFGEDGTLLAESDTPGMVALRTRRPVRGFLMRVTRTDGERRWVLVDSVPLFDGGDVPAQVLTSFIDITDRKLAELDLERRALHDQLTGLPNRRVLMDRLAQALLARRRQGSSVALLFIDLDRFKLVNDALGHRRGDRVLQQVAKRLRCALRDADTLARFGGDEFLVLLPVVTSPDAGALVAQKLAGCLREPFSIAGHSLQIAASIGIAVAPQHGSDPDTLLRRADMAMYAAKRGRHGWTTYAPGFDRTDVIDVEADLRLAIERGELTLHYQPVVELGSGRCVGVEALVRWPHATRGLLLPEAFVPLAEESGLISPLTSWLLDQALAQDARWRDEGLVMPVRANISAGGPLGQELAQMVRTGLDRYRLPGTALGLEITEGAMLPDAEDVADTLRRLHDLGVLLSVDDYGAGFASLDYLRRVPLDEVKIDRTYVSGLLHEPRSEAIVRSTIQLCHDLGYRVVAEGIEDEATLTELVTLGCDLAQGHYFAPAMPADRLEAWVAGTGLAEGVVGDRVDPNGSAAAGATA